MRLGPGNLSGGGVTMPQLSTTLSQFVQRVVVDRTGLTGNFDIDLTWTPDQFPQGRGEPPPGVQLPPNRSKTARRSSPRFRSNSGSSWIRSGVPWMFW